MSTVVPAPSAPAPSAPVPHDGTRTRAPESTEGPAHGHEFFRPRSAVWWLYCVMVAIGVPGWILLWSRKFTAAADSITAAAFVFVITFLVLVGLILWADRYRARRPWILVLAVMYGASAPVWLALHANQHLFALALSLLPPGVGEDWGAAIAGPTSEEWGKMLGTLIIMLIASRTLRRPMHGLLVGAFVGLGLEIVENVSYAASSALSDANSDYPAAFAVSILRGILGISSHWLYAGIAGVGVAWLLGRTVRRRPVVLRVLVFVLCFGLAWGLHFLWNAPSPEGFELAILPLKIIFSLACFILVVTWVWHGERAYLRKAEAELRGSPLAAEIGLSEDPAVTSAVGTRRQRRRALKAARKEHGRKHKRMVKKERVRYLHALQAWGRRGTGVDELPLTRTS